MLATVGAVSNPDNSNQNLGKAGRSRYLGRRPTVRGVVMNQLIILMVEERVERQVEDIQ